MLDEALIRNNNREDGEEVDFGRQVWMLIMSLCSIDCSIVCSRH